jgi:hypothetical protein
MSEPEPWYAGFDVVDFETTPISELPEDDGFHLICPVEGCEHQAEFDDLPAVADSDWSDMSRKDQILIDGTTLKEAYCPAHSLNETETTASESITGSFQQFMSDLRNGLGTPLDTHDSSEKPAKAKSEYSMYDFAEGEVSLDGTIVTRGCDSCYRQEEVDSPEDAEDGGWVSGHMIGVLSDGRMLLEGRCPEHRDVTSSTEGDSR